MLGVYFSTKTKEITAAKKSDENHFALVFNLSEQSNFTHIRAMIINIRKKKESAYKYFIISKLLLDKSISELISICTIII